MDIEEKCRSDLIERYKRLEAKEAKQARGLAKTLKTYLLDNNNQIVAKPATFRTP